MPVMTQRIVELVHEAELCDEKIVFIVGQPGSGKSKIMRELSDMRGWEYIDCRTLITEEILELMPKARPAEAPRIMSSILAKLEADVVLLDRAQVLFTPVLRLEPMTVLRQISRKRLLVVAWPGEMSDGKLIFVQNDRLPSQEYDATGLKIIQID